jgi:SAM-dependent methyltransferase
MSKYRDDLEKYLKTLNVKAEAVLDVGGSANPIKDRVKKFDVKNYKILDNNNEKGLHKKWREPDFKGDLNYLYFRSWNQIPKWYKEHQGKEITYDVVFCLEVFEYIWNPYSALGNIYLLLKNGGVAYISIPFGYPVHEPIEDDSLRMTREGFIKLAKRGFNFEVLECFPRYYSPEAFNGIKNGWKVDRLKMAKNYPYHNVVGWIYKIEKI